MIAAPLFVKKDGDARNWGTYRFDQLPAPGDRISIMDYRDRVQILTVRYVQHEPLRDDQPVDPERVTSFVHAEWVEEFY